MKPILFFVTLLLSANSILAQDTLTTKKGDELFVKILEVGTNSIKYKKMENIDGPIFETFKSDIFMIKYQNGTRELFNQQSISNKSTDTLNISCYQAKKDAKKHYHRTGFAFGGTLITSLASPLLGLIPAIACASSAPKESRLNYPSALKMQNDTYAECYANAAKKKKSKKVWTAWGIGLAVNVVAVLALTLGAEY